MIQNILALAIVFLAAGISIYAVIRSITSKNGGHCSGCSACGTSSSHTSKTEMTHHIDYKKLVFDGKGK